MDFRLRAATSADIALIRALAIDIWNRHYPSIIGQEQVDYMLAQNYSEEKIASDILTRAQHYFLIEVGGQSQGFCAVSEHDEGHGFLHKLYVIDEARGKGLGSKAIQAIRAQYPQWSFLRLQVNRQNYTAINFYFSTGFVIEQVADFDIGEGYQMNDFIMKLKLKE